MFTREEASRLRQEFWTAFGKYMNPVPSSEGLKISWINYHTTVKHIYFRMDAGLKNASIYVSIEHPDPIKRKELYDQFLKSKKLFRAAVGEAWKWQSEIVVEGKTVSRISKELSSVSVMNKDQWPNLITFFKPRIISLDAFWEDARYGFYEIS